MRGIYDSVSLDIPAIAHHQLKELLILNGLARDMVELKEFIKVDYSAIQII